MRLLLLILGILAVAAGISSRAEAQNYPWCAYYSGGDAGGGGTNCGFTSFEQCMATVSGIGGFCALNTQYVASGAATPAARKRVRHKSHPHS